MAMNIATDGDEDEVMSAINTTPLVDVMLVLLIIFLLTIPVAIQTVPVELPKASSELNQTQPENITLAVDKDGKYYWNATRVESREEMLERLIEIAKAEPQPEIQVRGDLSVRFEAVGRLILDIQRAGVQKVGFITEPVQGD